MSHAGVGSDRRARDPEATRRLAAVDWTAGTMQDTVRRILADGADPDARMPCGRFPLHIAANLVDAGVIAMLLAAGADPRRAVDDAAITRRGMYLGSTAIHLVVRAESGSGPVLRCAESIIRSLVEAGADPDAVDASGNAPLLFAMRARPSIATALIAHGADIRRVGHAGQTCLHHAACPMVGLRSSIRDEQHAVERMRLCLDHGVDPDVMDDAGDTPFAWAMRGSSLIGASTLLDAGADPAANTSPVPMSPSERWFPGVDRGTWPRRLSVAAWIHAATRGAPPGIHPDDVAWVAGVAARHAREPWSMGLLAAASRDPAIRASGP